MTVYNIIYIIVTGAILGMVIHEFFTGKSIFGKFRTCSPVLDALKLLCQSCNGIVGNDYFNKAATVLSACIDATTEAERLWKEGEIAKEERGNYCELMVASMLKHANIEVTEQIQSIIDGAVAIVCMLMPHSGLAENMKEIKNEETEDGKED